ncbi:MAG: hypothetical protein HIU86_01140 [Acidobacteria bacterium]|nr:hypothetical protein [Acidobacteriota bacterium]
MTGPDATGDLLRVPGVERVFPARRIPGTLLQAVAGVTEVGIGVSDGRPIPDTALAALAALRSTLPDGSRVRLRIAAVA